MKELYRKDLANHPGPEPCEGDRKVALEALDIHDKDFHDKDLSRENTHLLGLIGRISGEATVAGLTVCTDLPNWIR